MRRLLVSLGLALAMGTIVPFSAAQTGDVVIIVHPDTEATTVSKSELSKIFLKRLRTWSNGDAVIAVDLVPESPVREWFSKLVHERSVITVEVYWKRMIFSGRGVPPKELASSAAVVEFVRTTPGAVGYVSALAEREGVKLLSLQDSE